ncbi:MAG: DUF308 domain-containing protein [Ruminiclostridium sp.]|jgi:Uncharacterized conserved protein|nr:DUF308 domain-containing protein [Ruminiclostridium sp.]
MREEKDISIVMSESEEETRVPLIFQVVVEIVIGIFLIIYRDMTTNVLFIVIGAMMVCYGVFDLIAFVTNNRNYSFRRGLTSGVLITIIGVAFIVQAEELRNLLSIIIGALILIESIVNCRRAIILKNFGYGNWFVLLFASCALIAFGILICIYPGMFGEVISLILGVVMIFEAVLDGYAIIFMSYLRGKFRKQGYESKSSETAIVEANPRLPRK